MELGAKRHFWPYKTDAKLVIAQVLGNMKHKMSRMIFEFSVVAHRKQFLNILALAAAGMPFSFKVFA
jgi:hypothetical protein